MPSCSQCGHESAESSRFCPNCGAPLAQTPAASETQPLSAAAPTPRPDEPSTRTLPPPAADTVTAGPAVPHIDLSRLLVGNWLGAGLVAASALVTSGVLAVALALLGKPTDFGWDNSLTLVAVLMTGAFGADLSAEFGTSGFEADAAIGAFPLTITILTLVAALLVFRRVTASYTRGIDAVADAVRAALIFGLALMVIALVFRSDTREFGRGWGAELSRSFDARIAFGADAAGAFFLGFLILLVVLVGACLVRGGWWSPRVEKVRDWVAAPLYGVGIFAVLLPVVGAIGFLLLMVSGDAVDDATDPSGEDIRITIALVVSMLASGGMWLLGLGAGAAFGTQSGGTDGDASDTHHLAHFTDESPGLWAAPAVMLATVVVTALLVARRAPRRRVALNLLVWVAAVLVTTPLFVRLSGLHASIDVSGEGDEYEGWGSIGLVGWQATLLLTLVALLVALIVAWRAGGLDVTRLRTQARDLGQRVQSNPGRQPPPPVQEPAPQPAPPSDAGQFQRPAQEPGVSDQR